MYITDPFQFSAMSYRFMGVMVEQQLRVIKVLGDAALASHPLLSSPVTKRETLAPNPKVLAPSHVSHLAKTAGSPKSSPKRPRQPSAPPAFQKAPANGTAIHPAE
ncbi:MAG: hypothetical protein AAF641_01905 [Pseudomonadota bacterium]